MVFHLYSAIRLRCPCVFHHGRFMFVRGIIFVDDVCFLIRSSTPPRLLSFPYSLCKSHWLAFLSMVLVYLAFVSKVCTAFKYFPSAFPLFFRQFADSPNFFRYFCSFCLLQKAMGCSSADSLFPFVKSHNSLKLFLCKSLNFHPYYHSSKIKN